MSEICKICNIPIDLHSDEESSECMKALCRKINNDVNKLQEVFLE